MDTSKIIKGVVSNGRYTVTAPIVKEDYGLYLQIEGVELPSTYEVDFSNDEHHGTSVTMIGNADGVLIPHQFIETGKDVFAFLYHVGADYGRTVYKFRIPNKVRPDRTNEEPTPEEQSVIDQTINALNSAVEQTAQDVIDADASAQSASADAERAEEARTDAQNYATQAEQARDDAQTYANNASASATASAQSASEAQSASTNAETYALNSGNKAVESAQSAQASANSATQAQGYAQSASASANSASGYASQADISANTASTKASEASTSAQTASNKASEASQSASQASGYAQTAETAKTDAQTAKIQAETARDNAVTAKTAAETAQGKAEDAQAAAESVAESIPSDYSQLSEDVSDLKEGLSDLDERVADLEAGGSGGMSMTAVNLLHTILGEGVYGTDQSANIELLYKELSNVKPVSITATLTSRALVGMQYSELTFEITATFDDESTSTVTDGYRVTTTGAVHSGSNTVTVRYRGVTTNVTFTAEQVVTHTITYNLTDVTSSNNTTAVVDGSYYSTVLSVPTDYGFNGCTVTMGGVDITATAYSNMEILITQVTGDVVITASATEIVPITDTTQTHIKTRVYSFSDNGQNSINQNYYGSELHYTKHNFRNASKVTVTVANNTDNDITAQVFAGEIPTNVDRFADTSAIRFKPNITNVELWNAKKITPSSNVIPAGGYVSADIDITAGRRIAVSLPSDMTTLDVTMIGAYDPIDYSTEYDLLGITALGGATTTGRTYYSDAGTTIVKNGSNVWGNEFYNNSYQWDTSKAYYIVKRYEPQDNTVKFGNAFIEGFGTETRTKTVYNCNSLCDSDHWNGEKFEILPFFDYIGTIQPLSGYPVYTTFVHNDNCKVYVKEVTA